MFQISISGESIHRISLNVISAHAAFKFPRLSVSLLFVLNPIGSFSLYMHSSDLILVTFKRRGNQSTIVSRLNHKLL